MNSSLFSELGEIGWGKLRFPNCSRQHLFDEVVQLSKDLGTSVTRSAGSTIDLLFPKDRSEANNASLSGKYGLGDFPLHCDTAHWPVPCRYIVLACIAPGDRSAATVLLDTHSIDLSPTEKQLATSALFFVRSGRRSFYATILSANYPFVRVDPGCLEPTSPHGIDALDLYERKRRTHLLKRIYWEAGDILVIDNWRVLHGRDAVGGGFEQRTLMRSLVL